MTSLASIMVALDETPGADGRVRLAHELAKRCGARLIGAAGRLPMMSVVPGPSSVGIVVVEEDVEQARQDNIAIEDRFRRLTGADQPVSVRTDVERPSFFICRQASAADLIVVGRQGAKDERDWRFSPDPVDVVLGTGRPVLVVPPGLSHLAAECAVVGWRNTREARRAVRDAIPLLAGAKKIVVAAIDPDEDTTSVIDTIGLLRDHKLPASARTQPAGSRSDGDALLGIAQEEGADLIVAGAFGHTRLREWILAESTRI